MQLTMDIVRRIDKVSDWVAVRYSSGEAKPKAAGPFGGLKGDGDTAHE